MYPHWGSKIPPQNMSPQNMSNLFEGSRARQHLWQGVPQARPHAPWQGVPQGPFMRQGVPQAHPHLLQQGVLQAHPTSCGREFYRLMTCWLKRCFAFSNSSNAFFVQSNDVSPPHTTSSELFSFILSVWKSGASLSVEEDRPSGGFAHNKYGNFSFPLHFQPWSEDGAWLQSFPHFPEQTWRPSCFLLTFAISKDGGYLCHHFCQH